MPITDKLIDQLPEGCSSPDDILGESGLLRCPLPQKHLARSADSGLYQLGRKRLGGARELGMFSGHYRHAAANG